MPIFTETGYPAINTDDAIDLIVRDMLHCFHGRSDGLDSRIEKVYQEEYGVPFMSPSKVLPSYLHGSPGHGKTTTFKEAAKRIAKLLSMDLQINPGDTYTPGVNDLVFVSMELSGQVSAVDFGGIPTKMEEIDEDGNKYPYMTKLPSKRLAMLAHAPAAMLLLDDFANASPAIQNVALSVLDEGRFQGLDLGNTLVGVTGNLGSLDRTHTSRSSSALDTRCRNFYVEDEMPKFIDRIERMFKDNLGDCGLVGFMRSNEDSFAVKPAEKGPYPCPRSWTNFAHDLRSFVYVNSKKMGGNKETVMLSVSKLITLASSIVGQEHGEKFGAYYKALMSGAEPLAKEYMDEGKITKDSEKLFLERYEQGHSAANQDFGTQFAIALANHTVRKINEDPEKNLEEAVKNYSSGLFRLANNVVALSATHFINRLANQVDDYLDNSKAVKTEIKKQIVQEMVKHPRASGDRVDTVIEAITGHASVTKSYLGGGGSAGRRKKDEEVNPDTP